MNEKTKIVKTSLRDVVVKEFIYGDLKKMAPKIKEAINNGDITKAFGVLEAMRELSTDLRDDELDKLYFSDIEAIENAIKEVNSPLFRYSSRGKILAQTLGLQKVPQKVIEKIVNAFLKRLEGLQLDEEIEESPKEIEEPEKYWKGEE